MEKEERKEGIHKGRDSKGRFLPGSCPHRPPKKQPGEIIKIHPTNPYRDIHGRILPGYTGNPAVNLRNVKLAELKAALLDDCLPKLKQVMNELHSIAMDKEAGRHTQLEAMELYLNRILGKPSQPIESTIDTKTVNTQVNVDFTKLSEQELLQIESILSKTEGPVIEIEYKAQGEQSTNQQ